MATQFNQHPIYDELDKQFKANRADGFNDVKVIGAAPPWNTEGRDIERRLEGKPKRVTKTRSRG